MAEWFKDWFDSNLYLDVYNHRDEGDAKKLCNLILETAQLKSGAKILDAACGAGRHANYFSSLGFDVTGFDLSKTLLKVAIKDSHEKKLNTKFICADIRNIFFSSKFDLVANLFTSFGYFSSDEENFSFIKNSYDFLNPGGFYFLDYLNPVLVKNKLVKESSKEIGDIKISELRNINNSRIEKEIIVTQNGTEKRFTESVSLYSEVELLDKISNIGFKSITIFGDYDGNDFNEENSSRMILVFRK